MYPLIIIDRYTGAYSHGKYTAWNDVFYRIPKEVEANDVECLEFWSKFKQGEKRNIFNKLLYIGIGNTPIDALEDLKTKTT